MEKLHLTGFAENTPKYRQIVDSIIEAIRGGDLKKGKQIPSINELSEEYLLSRDTVEKAYKQLRQQGIIMSVKGKGYFINRTNVNSAIRVLLVFNKISNYKKQVYNAFVNAMGKQAIVDLHIHHFNTQVFKSIIDNHLGDYDYYVVMPHFYEHIEDAIQVIKEIPPDKLILLDKNIPEIRHNYAAVYQDFERDISEALHEAMDLLGKYNRLIFVNPNLVPYPPEIVNGFRYFCRMHDFDFDIIREIDINTPVQRNTAYIVIEEMDLVNFIKDCKNRGLIIGKDIGVISYNDTPLKEILLQGITVISTDHERMGETAARMILDKDFRQVKNPFSLIRRASL